MKPVSVTYFKSNFQIMPWSQQGAGSVSKHTVLDRTPHVYNNPKMTTHSRILAWKIPWTEEPGRLQFMGSQRAGHD